MKLFAFVLAFIFFTTAGCPSLSWGFTYRQVGVDSNLLIDNERVLFAQSDGSLTVLSLESGAVLLREKSRDYSGTFKRVNEGILVLNYGMITLLNPTNFNPVWETKSHYDANIIDDLLVSYDGNGLVECRDLKTGTIKWTFNLGGALDVVAESGFVLVHRAAKYDQTAVPTTVLLELQTGRELLRKEPPMSVHWDRVFFDGTNICVMVGGYEVKRSDFLLERMAIWNRRGEEIQTISMNDEQRKSLRLGGEVFDLETKSFYNRRVYASRELIPHDPRGRWIAIHSTGEKDSTRCGFDLGGGFAVVEQTQKSVSQSGIRATGGLEIELQTPDRSKRGILPYLTDRGRISAVGKAKGRILLGTSMGHVECIDVATGESQWLYVFPTMRHTMSYCTHGMPPMVSRAAAIYRIENGTLPKSGFQSADGNPARTRIITDPDPTDPFRKLPLYVSIAWGGAVVPILLMLAFHVTGIRRVWNPVSVGGAAISFTVLALICFLGFGRVSVGSSIALRLAILAGLVIGTLQAVRCYRRGRQGWAAAFVGLLLCIAGFIFPAFFAL